MNPDTQPLSPDFYGSARVTAGLAAEADGKSVPPSTSVELHDPDWRRLPGYREVSERDWRDSRWQLRHAVRDVAGLRAAFGHFISDRLLTAIDTDQRHFATMPLLVPPQILSVMDERNLELDGVRRYMLPAASDRDTDWPSHPMARRDSLYEALTWSTEGLAERYPGKALAEIVTTCPQYCGHCTRMDLVGQDTSQVRKKRFSQPAAVRREHILARIRADVTIRDVVVSGGDIANVAPAALAKFVGALLDIDHVRDIRLASKALVALPQHFLRSDVLQVLEQLAASARHRGVELSLHTHANTAATITRLVREAVRCLANLGIGPIRNQAVLLKGVNDSVGEQLRLAYALLETRRIVPYYVYLCDMVPNVEHWRTPLSTAHAIAAALVGQLPGYATPTVVCDVPGAGKRPVHMVAAYDRTLGISVWDKAFTTPLDALKPPPAGHCRYFDPLTSLPAEGRAYWQHYERDRVPG